MKRRYSTLSRFLLALAVASCKEKASDLLSPLDALDLCKPGGSSDACLRKVFSLDDAFPAGRLDGMDCHPMDIELGPHLRSHNGVLRYEMEFHDDTDDVEQVLRSELGEPLKNRQPPIVPKDYLLGDLYWVTPDGLWEYKRHHHVVWFSDAFHSSNPKGFIDVSERLDQYVHPAPLSAALWKKIGVLLIGSDVEPIKIRKQTPESR